MYVCIYVRGPEWIMACTAPHSSSMLIHWMTFVYHIPLCGAERDSQNCLQSASHCHNDLHSGRQCVALCTPASLHHLSAMRIGHINSVVYQNGIRLRDVICLRLCPYLPQWCVELMDDHFHLLTASKSHDSVIARKRTRLREVGHWVEKNKNNNSQDNLTLWSHNSTVYLLKHYHCLELSFYVFSQVKKAKIRGKSGEKNIIFCVAETCFFFTHM